MILQHDKIIKYGNKDLILKDKSFTVSVEVFRLEVGVFTNYKDLINYVKGTFNIKGLTKSDFEVCDAEAGILFDKNGVQYFYILLPEKPRTGLIAHECSHMADYICDSLGMPISMKATEIRAYLVDYLTQSISEEMERNEME